MKTKFFNKYLFTIIIGQIFANTLFAHENTVVHPTLTKYAYQVWSVDHMTQLSLAWGFGMGDALAYNGHTRTIGGSATPTDVSDSTIGWLAQGAVDEDGFSLATDPRFTNHFYNPIGGVHQLTDGINPWAPFYGTPSDSYIWATNGSGEKGPNLETWPLARSYAYTALTAANATSRQEALAHTFYALGKIIHLVQDLTQPDHARNDAHPISVWRWIENYGFDAISNLGAATHNQLKANLDAATPLNWRDAGFTKLKDFWTRGYYTGEDSTALDDDASGDITKTLGMAEFSNGNFLGEDATYPEWLNSLLSNKRFPFPNLASTTNGTLPVTVSGAPDAIAAAQIGPMLGQDGSIIGNGLYLQKVKDGIPVTFHSAVLYSNLHTRNYDGPFQTLAVQSHPTVQEVQVLKNYHEILLPKAVSYSAALLDYFFRGKLDVSVTWDDSGTNTYKLTITNVSGQAMHGGDFLLYADSSRIEADRNRQPVSFTAYLDDSLQTAWDADNSTLEDQDSVYATIQPDSSAAGGYMLVYQGTIGYVSIDGSEGGYALDPAESDADGYGLALAAYHFDLPMRFNITWDQNADIDIYLSGPGSDDEPIYYSNLNGSSLGELDHDDTTHTGPENITLKQLPDGNYNVWVNYYTNHTVDGTSNSAPAIAVTLKCYVNGASLFATRTFTLNSPNHGQSRPDGNASADTLQDCWFILKTITLVNGNIQTSQ